MKLIQIKTPKGGLLNLKVDQRGQSIGYKYEPSEAYLKAHKQLSSEERQETIRQNQLGSIRHKKIYNGVAEAVVKVLDKVQVSHLGDSFDKNGKRINQRKVF